MQTHSHITLSQLQRLVKETLHERFALPVWVSAEISEIKVNYSGHCYLELVEKGGDNGVPLAQSRAVIWRTAYPRIAGYFEAETGQRLAAGIKILAKVAVNYHELYGFSLQITDIDPTYTLGDMERQRQITIAQLQQEGVWDMNREAPMPVVVQRVAVVSSANAAGYQDFRKELEQQKTAWRSGQNTGAVTAEDVAAVVSGWTGVPVTTLTEAESARLLGLEEALHRRVVGQEEAVRAVARAVRRGRVGLKEPGRPTGCFLFLGPTGVGKTELCKALAATLFGSEEALLRFDMSEYMEKHAVSRLIGSPPGYVGHEEGGQLTEKVRRRPYCVVLFDEIEKAHPDIWGILLQIMEDGMVTDAQGRKADFKNAIVVLTSNVGAARITAKGSKLGFSATERRDGETRPIEELKAAVLDDLKKVFRPEFLNRLDETIVFTQLGRTEIQAIARRMLERVGERMKALGVTLRFTDRALETLADQGFDPDYGARPLRRTIRAQVEDVAAEQLLSGALQAGDTALVDGAENGLRLYAQPAGTQALNTKENEL